MEIKRPKLKIIGTDGNAYALLGKAMSVAKKNKMDWNSIQKEAMSGDYDNLLAVLMRYFDVY